jgi:endonuclease/exonuclease/phosphatase (EEP) superfamily protein YafD
MRTHDGVLAYIERSPLGTRTYVWYRSYRLGNLNGHGWSGLGGRRNLRLAGLKARRTGKREMKPITENAAASRPAWLTVTGYLGWLAAGCVAAATLAGFLADLWWVFDLTSHFRVQYLVASAVLFIAALALRRFAIGLVAATLLIVNLYLVTPLYYPRALTTEQPADIRLMMLNVHSSNRQFARVRALIEEESPDVLLVLEFNEQWRVGLEEIEAKYPFSERAPRAHNFGIAIYSRLPFEQVSVIEISQQQLPAITASIQCEGRRLTFFGVHVLPPVSRTASAHRNQQFHDVASLVRLVPGPVVVAGDLNCTTWSPFFGRLVSGAGLVDSRRGRGLQATWPTFMPWLMIPIDHCLVSPDLEVVGRHVTPAFGSDHLGIVIDLRVRKTGTAAPSSLDD